MPLYIPEISSLVKTIHFIPHLNGCIPFTDAINGTAFEQITQSFDTLMASLLLFSRSVQKGMLCAIR